MENALVALATTLMELELELQRGGFSSMKLPPEIVPTRRSRTNAAPPLSPGREQTLVMITSLSGTPLTVALALSSTMPISTRFAVELHTTGGPEVGESVTLFQVFGYILLVVAVILVLRILALIFRRET